METHLIKLNNKLNRKRIDYIEIQGTCNKAGRIKQQFTEIMKYEDEYDIMLHSLLVNLVHYFLTLLQTLMINFTILKMMFLK